MNIENLVRPNIRQLKPYQSARQIYDFSKISGKKKSVLLDANENAIGSSVPFRGVDLNRYPDPYQNRLRERLAELNASRTENIFIGSGSDEVIDLLIRIFCEPAVDSILQAEPTYGMYRVAANIHNVVVISSPLTDEFQLDVDDILRRKQEGTKIIFCCSPNNPTGNLLNPADIAKLCSSTESIVVVDEAYVDFADNGTVAGYCSEYQNLAIMRTFSKAWGMAGIRLGYCVADPSVINYLLRVKMPYNVNSVTAKIALRAFDEEKKRKGMIKTLRRERDYLTKKIAKLRAVRHVYPSDANFILVKVSEAGRIYEQLAERGIIVRDRSFEPKLDNCLRITVGTRGENDRLLRAMKEIDK